MPKYEYEAITLKGGSRRKFRGIIEAPSGELALMDLLQRQLYPTSLREMSGLDVAVAGRLANFKKVKSALTSQNQNVVVRRALPPRRFQIPWAWVGWGTAIVALAWALLR